MEVIIATDREVWIAEPELFYIGPWAREDVYDRLINALENNDREVINELVERGDVWILNPLEVRKMVRGFVIDDE